LVYEMVTSRNTFLAQCFSAPHTASLAAAITGHRHLSSCQ
jgi:hypothetical protein